MMRFSLLLTRKNEVKLAVGKPLVRSRSLSRSLFIFLTSPGPILR
jgi:hypothetical protein